jgi:hypothetical protein
MRFPTAFTARERCSTASPGPPERSERGCDAKPGFRDGVEEDSVNKDVGRKPLFPSGAINWRLATFKSMLPQLDKVDLLQVARNIELGNRSGPLDYGALDPEHRQQATTIARAFTKLKPPKNASGAPIGPNVSEIVSKLLFEVKRCDEDALLTRPRQQIYVFDAKV